MRTQKPLPDAQGLKRRENSHDSLLKQGSSSEKIIKNHSFLASVPDYMMTLHGIRSIFATSCHPVSPAKVPLVEDVVPGNFLRNSHAGRAAYEESPDFGVEGRLHVVMIQVEK